MRLKRDIKRKNVSKIPIHYAYRYINYYKYKIYKRDDGNIVFKFKHERIFEYFNVRNSFIIFVEVE